MTPKEGERWREKRAQRWRGYKNEVEILWGPFKRRGRYGNGIAVYVQGDGRRSIIRLDRFLKLYEKVEPTKLKLGMGPKWTDARPDADAGD